MNSFMNKWYPSYKNHVVTKKEEQYHGEQYHQAAQAGEYHLPLKQGKRLLLPLRPKLTSYPTPSPHTYGS